MTHPPGVHVRMQSPSIRQLVRLGAFLLALVVGLSLVATPAQAAEAKKKHKKRYAVSLSVSRSTVTPGSTVTLRGSVSPKAKGKKVSVQRRLGSGSWVTIATPTLPRSSTYAVTTKLSAEGSYAFRTVKGGSKKRRAGSSPARGVRVAPPAWRQVSGGSYHTCGVKVDGTMWCWGRNDLGQLGSATNVGTVTATPKPQRVGTSANWVSVTTGQYHSCGVMRDHTAWCWGYNALGQLGNATNSGTTAVNKVPLKVGGGASWVSLSSGGGQTTCGLQLDHTVWCWGNNGSGQLGSGAASAGAHPSPSQVGAASDWTAISTGYTHACGLRAGGSAWCWGENSYGRIGDGTTTQRPSPSQVGSGTAWVAIAAGDYHTCGRKSDNSLWCWGYNYYGEVGTATNFGTANANPSPLRVGSGTNWASVTSGSTVTCASKTDKSVWCWGSNSDGERGDGTGATSSSAPSVVSGNASWTQVDAGDSHVCAARNDGTAWCWGQNVSGQLGNATNAGTSTRNPDPLKVG